jgi:glycosyltransferase involved in cell wall biosynthesis
MLSICTTVKNRSFVRVDGHELRLFPKCVEAIVRARDENMALELVVADWESDDWPLDQWLNAAAGPIPVRLQTLGGTFSRGRGMNTAANAARGNYLLFLDADALLNPYVLRRGTELAQRGTAYFPMFFGFNEPEHQTGRWFDRGYGTCAISKKAFEQTGGWPEYRSWGDEDIHFWMNVSRLFPVVREQAPGFYHQWHPDDLYFKNRYGEETDKIRQTRDEDDRENQVVDRLRRTLPLGSRYILVDEDRTGIRNKLPCEAVPFLGRDGLYWGPPADDVQAIREFERLRDKGAQFIVFPWVAFWWLEHYRDWANHLDSTARCLEKTDLVVVYDLQQRAESKPG